jgi:hypothetical protein
MEVGQGPNGAVAPRGKRRKKFAAVQMGNEVRQCDKHFAQELMQSFTDKMSLDPVVLFS